MTTETQQENAVRENAPEPVTDTQITDAAPARSDATEQLAEPTATPSDGRDDRLKAIAERLKNKRRETPEPEFSGDMRDATQTYGSVAMPHGEETAGADEPPAAQTQDPPQKRRMILKVLGQEREVDEDEVIALAQKAAAGDNYLEEARRIRDDARNSQRAPAARPNQDGESAHHEAHLDHEPSDPNKGRDEFETLAEEIQLGDPREAGAKMRNAVQTAAQKALLERDMRDDHRATMEAFEKFASSNKELVSDKRAEAVVKDLLAEAYADDLRSIGVPEDRIPKDVNELADWHRFYRVQRRPVRSATKLLEDAKDGYLKWKGVAPTPVQQQPQSRPSAPRVAVARDDRRAAIPTQPTRATTPQQVAPSGQPQNEGQRRASVIRKMQESRRGTSAS